MELLSYDIPSPGSYVMTMTGTGDEQAAVTNPQEEHSPFGPEAMPKVRGPGSTVSEMDAVNVVFTRTHLGRTVAYVVGMVLASGVFISSLVFFLLRLLAKGSET